MKVSEENIRVIVEELRYVADKMVGEEDILGKVYYLSGSYAVIHRVMNLEYDDELVLIHRILMSAYETLSSRVNSIITGQERVIKIPVEAVDALANSIRSLATVLSEKKEYKEILAKVAAIGYIGTGNGYYLYKKGILKL